MEQSQRHKIMIVFGGLFALIIIVFMIRFISYWILRHDTNQQATTVVAVTAATQGPKQEKIILPGTVMAWHEAAIYARTNGYVDSWTVDIGAKVKMNDTLALIKSPEVDAAFHQAEADLKLAEANHTLAETTAKRWLSLLKTDSVSKQETDEKVSSAEATAAQVVASRSNRDRLLELMRFESVIAPFDGVVTARLMDVGSLINSGSGTAVRPLFRIAQADRLRIYVKVPQDYAHDIKPEMKVMLYFPDHPGKSYPAKLLDTAKAIDPATRTLLVQYTVDNADYALFPGGYTEVHLFISTPKNTLRLPINAFLFRAEGLQVATVTADHKVKLLSVEAGRDFGKELEVLSGIKPDQTVIVNPPDSLFEGQQVRTVAAPTEEASSETHAH